MQAGLTPSKASDDTTILSADATPPIASYRGPGPPPPSTPHRYIFLLYEQPEDFNVSQMGILKRIRYDFETFEKEAKLGPAIASNYFLSN